MNDDILLPNSFQNQEIKIDVVTIFSTQTLFKFLLIVSITSYRKKMQFRIRFCIGCHVPLIYCSLEVYTSIFDLMNLVLLIL